MKGSLRVCEVIIQLPGLCSHSLERYVQALVTILESSFRPIHQAVQFCLCWTGHSNTPSLSHVAPGPHCSLLNRQRASRVHSSLFNITLGVLSAIAALNFQRSARRGARRINLRSSSSCMTRTKIDKEDLPGQGVDQVGCRIWSDMDGRI